MVEGVPPWYWRLDGHMLQAFIGKNVTLRCKAIGSPVPTITWYKDGMLLQKDTTRPNTNVLYIIRKWSLQLTSIRVSDNGNYSCIARNRFGEIAHYIEVHAIYPPITDTRLYFVSESTNQTVYEGQNVTLKCEVKDVSGVHTFIQWVKHYQVNGSWFTDATEDTYNIKKVLNNKDVDNPQLYHLTSVTLNDSGWYTCVASNSNKENYMLSHWLFVRPIPPTSAAPSPTSAAPPVVTDDSNVLNKLSSSHVILLVVALLFIAIMTLAFLCCCYHQLQHRYVKHVLVPVSE